MSVTSRRKAMPAPSTSPENTLSTSSRLPAGFDFSSGGTARAMIRAGARWKVSFWVASTIWPSIVSYWLRLASTSRSSSCRRMDFSASALALSRNSPIWLSVAMICWRTAPIWLRTRSAI